MPSCPTICAPTSAGASASGGLSRRVRNVPGETQAVTLVIPGPPPPSLNQQERMHWAKRQRVRDWWAQQAWVVWLRAGQPRFERPVIQYRLYYRTNRRRDQDNAIASCKPILDGLKGHAFVDDHSGVVTILP